ncbi:MAG: hypothetical protein LH609_14485 [Rudanella sp.]|nr:hypothetical protein [Rudanella sp.]
MRLILSVLFLAFSAISSLAQNTPLLLSNKDFGPNQALSLSAMKGWLFKQGHNPAWAKQSLNTTDWQSFSPDLLSSLQADSKGRTEGWFCIKLKLDSSLTNVPLGAINTTWTAADVYLDGSLIASFGKTGSKVDDYREHSPFYSIPIPLQLFPNKVCQLAIHVVDQTPQLKPILPKSQQKSASLFTLTGPLYNHYAYQNNMEWVRYTTCWISVILVTVFLVWILSRLNLLGLSLRAELLGFLDWPIH